MRGLWHSEGKLSEKSIVDALREILGRSFFFGELAAVAGEVPESESSCLASLRARPERRRSASDLKIRFCFPAVKRRGHNPVADWCITRSTVMRSPVRERSEIWAKKNATRFGVAVQLCSSH